jgi:hypothetical protein
MNPQDTIAKLELQATSERLLGNLDTAASFEKKAEKLRRKYNLAPPVAKPAVVPSKSPVMQPPQKQSDYVSDFPGVKAPEAPLTNTQLAALRTLAASAGRPLTDRERAAVLGQKIEDAPKGDSKCDRYFEI